MYLFIFFTSFLSNAQSQNGSIDLTISDVPSQQGQLIIKLYHSEQNYRKTTFRREVIDIADNPIHLTFDSIPYGEYAISVIHDKNSNNKMDLHWFGMPSEDAASSNDAKGFMGPPKFKDAKFKVNEEVSIQRIKMKQVHSKK